MGYLPRKESMRRIAKVRGLMEKSNLERFLVGIPVAMLAVSAASGASEPPASSDLATPARLEIYPAPKDYPENRDYTVKVNGRPVHVYKAPVRLGKDAIMGFAYFDFEGKVDVEVKVNYTPIRQVVLRPLSSGVRFTQHGDTVRFTLTEPRKISFEVNNDLDRCLFLFGNPMEGSRPAPGQPGVIYYGPGMHDVKRLVIEKDNTTVYIAGGAVFKGQIVGERVNNVVIRGRGVIDGGDVPKISDATLSLRSQERPLVTSQMLIGFDGCGGKTGLVVSGVILIDPPAYAIGPHDCGPVNIDNVKIITKRFTGDGIDPASCRDVTIRDVMIRSTDDCISAKADDRWYSSRKRIERMTVSDSILWQEDNGCCIRLCGACSTDLIRDLSFRNIDMIHIRGQANLCGQGMEILLCDEPLMSRVTFEDIRVEDMSEGRRLINVIIGKLAFGHDPERGMVDRLTFRRVTCGESKPSVLQGCDEAHAVHRVLFEDCMFGGKPVTNPQDSGITIGSFVYGVSFVQTGMMKNPIGQEIPKSSMTLAEPPTEARKALEARYGKLRLPMPK